MNVWLPYIEDLSVPIEIDSDVIATWYTTAVPDGRYDLRLSYTRDNPITDPSPAATELARLRAGNGRRDEARALLAERLAGFAGEPDVPLLTRARSLAREIDA